MYFIRLYTGTFELVIYVHYDRTITESVNKKLVTIIAPEYYIVTLAVFDLCIFSTTRK